MLDIGWPELVVILIVALVVIGPKDLPRALHTVGKWVRKARLLAREFQSSVDDMVRQAELEDLRKQVNQLRRTDLSAEIEKTVDPHGAVREALTIDERLPPADGTMPSSGAKLPPASAGTVAAEMGDGAETPVPVAESRAAIAAPPASKGQ